MTLFTPKELVQIASRHALPIAMLLAGANALVWTLFAALGGSPALHQDSLEAYAWGREFQLGYYKHPPFWAWIAGLWFRLFPHTDWAFILLSEANASLGIVGTWALLGRFTKGPARLAGTLLLLLTTLYTFNAFRFNANTIELSLWPWTMYLFVVSIEKKTATSGIAFGLLAALSMLSKYYAAFLLAACLFAALIHRDRRSYFRSSAPWLAMLTCALLTAPHWVWVVQHHFQPFAYAAFEQARGAARFADSWLVFALICIVYHVLQLGVVGIVRFTDRNRDAKVPRLSIAHGTAFLSVLALTPFVLTVLTGIAGQRVTAFYAQPIFSLTPFLALATIGADATRVARLSALLYAAIVAGSLSAAPFLAGLGISLGNAPPYREITTRAVAEWRATTAAPLRIVAGSWPYDKALAFYAPGDVSEFTAFDFDAAPWITRERIASQGLLAACLADDESCRAAAARFQTDGTSIAEAEVSAAHGRAGTPSVLRFIVIATPPENH